MTCDHCNDGDDPNCLNCDGSGTICDICGEAADRGAALCESCHADRMADHPQDGNDDGPDPLPDHMHIINADGSEITDDDDGIHAQD